MVGYITGISDDEFWFFGVVKDGDTKYGFEAMTSLIESDQKKYIKPGYVFDYDPSIDKISLSDKPMFSDEKKEQAKLLEGLFTNINL